MKNAIFLLLTFLLLVSSCKKDDPIDLCETVACFNGGVCIEGVCECPPGFSGPNCEIMPLQDECDGVICNNGGICVNGLCDCTVGYTGPGCDTQVTPSRIRITKLTVITFPTFQPSGANWDFFDSFPDLYFQLHDSNGFLYNHPTVTGDATNTVEHEFIPASDLNMDNVTSTYTIFIKDDDGLDFDDEVGRIDFIPYSSNNGFPASLSLNNNGTFIKLDLVYSF